MKISIDNWTQTIKNASTDEVLLSLGHHNGVNQSFNAILEKILPQSQWFLAVDTDRTFKLSKKAETKLKEIIANHPLLNNPKT